MALAEATTALAVSQERTSSLEDENAKATRKLRAVRRKLQRTQTRARHACARCDFSSAKCELKILLVYAFGCATEKNESPSEGAGD